MICGWEGEPESVRRRRSLGQTRLRVGRAVPLGSSVGRSWNRNRYGGPYLRVSESNPTLTRTTGPYLFDPSKADGSKVPHPADKTKSQNLWSGVHGGLGSGIECSRCHDADAFTALTIEQRQLIDER